MIVALDQDLWATVHGIADRAGLTAIERSQMRKWVAERAEKMPGTVFARDPSNNRRIGIRPTFRLALEHSARDMKLGRLEGGG